MRMRRARGAKKWASRCNRVWGKRVWFDEDATRREIKGKLKEKRKRPKNEATSAQKTTNKKQLVSELRRKNDRRKIGRAEHTKPEQKLSEVKLMRMKRTRVQECKHANRCWPVGIWLKRSRSCQVNTSCKQIWSGKKSSKRNGSDATQHGLRDNRCRG